MDELVELKNQIEEKNNEIYALKAQLKNEQLIVKEYNLVKNLNYELRENIVKLKSEFDQIKNEKSSIEFENKKKIIEFENLTVSFSEKLKENEQLKTKIKQIETELKSLQAEILNKDCLKNENDEIKEKIIALNGDHVEIKDELIYYKQKNIDLANENKQLNIKIKTLKELLSINEKKSKVGTDKKSKRKEDILIDDQLENSGFGDSAENTLLKIENEKMRQLISKYEEKLNNASDQINGKNSALEKMQNDIDEKNKENEKLNEVIQTALSQNKVDNKRLRERESELSQLRKQVTLYQKELTDLKNTLVTRKQEMNSLFKEKSEIKINNDTLITDLENLQNELATLKQANDNLENEVAELTTIKQNNEINIREMATNLKHIAKERNRLKKNLDIFIDENKQAANHIKIIESDNEKLNSKNQTLQEDNTNLMQRVENLEKYNTELADQMEKMKKEISGLEMEYRATKQQNILDEEQNIKYETYITSLNHQISQLETQISLLQSKLEEMNIKSKIKIDDKENLTATIKNYENIISEERIKNKNASVIIDSLRKENKYIKEENERITKCLNDKQSSKLPQVRNSGTMSSDEDNEYLKQFISELHEQIDGLNNELLMVKNENMKLMSERNKSDVSANNIGSHSQNNTNILESSGGNFS